MSKRSSRAPVNFVIDADFAATEVPDMDVRREAERFRDYEFARGYSDWQAVWRNWVRRCRDSGQYARKHIHIRTTAELEAEEAANAVK
jgi:hypothetical protein